MLAKRKDRENEADNMLTSTFVAGALFGAGCAFLIAACFFLPRENVRTALIAVTGLFLIVSGVAVIHSREDKNWLDSIKSAASATYRKIRHPFGEKP